MNNSKVEIISETRSPLFRIMWVTNPYDSSKRQFDNNISAFHIGGGLVLSVAHNLRTENPLLKSIPDQVFANEILPAVNEVQKNFLLQNFVLDPASAIRHINVSNVQIVQGITDIIKSIKFDSRWFRLAEREMSIPHLIIQFTDENFYANRELKSLFNDAGYFFEPSLNRHTFLLKLELVKAFYSSDIAVYRIVNTDKKIINALPFVEPDFSVLNDDQPELYCLQSSPAGFLGRLLNKATIEGYLDQYQVFNDRIGGSYVLEGLRYLIKGYFRFGSSGAPYIIYNDQSGRFKVNAIQSEASPVQLSINNKMEGNFQYVNAIASPLKLIENELQEIRNSVV